MNTIPSTSETYSFISFRVKKRIIFKFYSKQHRSIAFNFTQWNHFVLLRLKSYISSSLFTLTQVLVANTQYCVIQFKLFSMKSNSNFFFSFPNQKQGCQIWNIEEPSLSFVPFVRYQKCCFFIGKCFRGKLKNQFKLFWTRSAPFTSVLKLRTNLILNIWLLLNLEEVLSCSDEMFWNFFDYPFKIWKKFRFVSNEIVIEFSPYGESFAIWSISSIGEEKSWKTAKPQNRLNWFFKIKIMSLIFSSVCLFICCLLNIWELIMKTVKLLNYKLKNTNCHFST